MNIRTLKLVALVIVGALIFWMLIYGGCRIFSTHKQCTRVLCEIEIMRYPHIAAEDTIFCN